MNNRAERRAREAKRRDIIETLQAAGFVILAAPLLYFILLII